MQPPNFIGGTSPLQASAGRTGARRLGVAQLCLFGFFGAEFGLPTLAGQPVPREIMIASNLVAFSFILVGCYALFLQHCLWRRIFVLGHDARKVAVVLFAWLLVSLIGVSTGLFSDHDLNFVLGDFYKYFKIVAVFFFSYFCFRDRTGSNQFLNWLVLLFLLLLVFDLLRSRDSIVIQQHRFTSYVILHGVILLPISLYLMRMSERRLIVLLNSSFLGLVLLALALSRTRSPILIAVCGIGTVLLFQRRQTSPSFRRLVFPVVALSIIGVASWFLLPDVLPKTITATASRFQLMQSIRLRYGDPERAIGWRAPEIRAILDRFVERPGKVALGFGMGSEIEIRSGLLGVSRTHSLHTGWFEIVFRLGVVGLVTLLVVYFSFLRLAYRARQKSDFMVVPLATGIQQVIVTIIGYHYLTDSVVFMVFAMMLAVGERQNLREGLLAENYRP